jgi:glucose-6-phosphate 1-dehydrogenase
VRIGLEKPLGNDLASSNRINDAVAAAFAENQIFRIDHYLGKETVQNLMALRFANMMFEPLWNSAGIDHIRSPSAKRWGWKGARVLRRYRRPARHGAEPHAPVAGADRDGTARRFRRDCDPRRKVKVLRATSGEGRRDGARPVSRRRGEGRKRQGYEDDLGQPSETETFVAIKAHVENWRWQGVPFYLRTGKRLGERRSEIVVEFKQVPHNIFGSRLRANRLVIRLQPEEYVRLQVMAKEPGLDRGGIVLREVNLDLR